MNTNLHDITRVVSYEMELGFSEIFKIYEMELETHGHGQIGKQNRVS